MRKNAEKPEFTKAKAVRVWAEVGNWRLWKTEIPYFYVILRKIGHSMDYS